MNLALITMGGAGLFLFGTIGVLLLNEMQAAPEYDPPTNGDALVLAVITFAAVNSAALMFAASRVTA